MVGAAVVVELSMAVVSVLGVVVLGIGVVELGEVELDVLGLAVVVIFVSLIVCAQFNEQINKMTSSLKINAIAN